MMNSDFRDIHTSQQLYFKFNPLMVDHAKNAMQLCHSTETCHCFFPRLQFETVFFAKIDLAAAAKCQFVALSERMHWASALI